MAKIKSFLAKIDAILARIWFRPSRRLPSEREVHKASAINFS